MHQTQVEQFSKEDMTLLDRVDDFIESAELELQRTVTMLKLGTDIEQAFEGVNAVLKKIDDTVSSMAKKEVQEIARENVGFFLVRMEEVVEQTK
ncbi:hypothetical protein [Viridibacillus arvi]|uniref:hypothetical protein n=1 Tax=Viridibacillus arvi TaxID=263475 RepID=UPI0034CEF746